jgi:ketosteroid isomerase-like protein
MSPIRMSRVESAVRIIIDLHNAFNTRDLDKIQALFSEDISFKDVLDGPEGVTYVGRRSVTQLIEDCFQNYPTAKLEQEELSGFGNRAILRWKLKWESKTLDQNSIRGISLFLVRNVQVFDILSYAPPQKGL